MIAVTLGVYLRAWRPIVVLSLCQAGSPRKKKEKEEEEEEEEAEKGRGAMRDDGGSGAGMVGGSGAGMVSGGRQW